MSQEIPYWFSRILRIAIAIIVIKLLLVAFFKLFAPPVKRSSV